MKNAGKKTGGGKGERIYAPTHAPRADGSGGFSPDLRPFRADKPYPDQAGRPVVKQAGRDERKTASGTDAKRVHVADLGKKSAKAPLPIQDRRVIKDISKAALRAKPSAAKRPKNRALAVCLSVVAIIMAICLLYFLFLIKDISVTGNETIAKEEVIAQSGIREGQHLWLIHLGNAQAALEAEPYIRSARITREYPDTIHIEITERKAVAVVVGMSAFAVIDNEGYVMSIDATGEAANLLRVVGMGAGGYSVNTFLGDETDFLARTLVSIIQAIERHNLMDTIRSIDVSNPMRIIMETFAGITVHFGQSDHADEKMEKLAIVLPEVTGRGYESGTIDISVQGDPVFSPPGATADPDATLDPNATVDPNAAASPTPATGPTPTPDPGAEPTDAPGST